jgi:hypothetical protein
MSDREEGRKIASMRVITIDSAEKPQELIGKDGQVVGIEDHKFRIICYNCKKEGEPRRSSNRTISILTHTHSAAASNKVKLFDCSLCYQAHYCSPSKLTSIHSPVVRLPKFV